MAFRVQQHWLDILKKTSYESYEFTVAWLGDSRAVVQDKLNNTVLFETIDHTPGNENEKQRIINEGGADALSVFENIPKVDGLAVSRAFGNRELNRKLIIQKPDIEQLTLTSEEGFVIFASDGIWSKISSEEAITIVTDAMKKSQQELDNEYPKETTVTWGKLVGEKDLVEEGGNEYLKRIARVLCYKAREKGSTDNLSVVVVDFDKDRVVSQDSLLVGNSLSGAKTSIDNNVPNQAQPSWWSSQSAMKKYIWGSLAALGLTGLGAYLYSKFYGKK